MGKCTRSLRGLVIQRRAQKIGRHRDCFLASQLGDRGSPFPRDTALLPVADDGGILDSEGVCHRRGTAQSLDQLIHGHRIITLCGGFQAHLYVALQPTDRWLVLEMPRMARSHQFKVEVGDRLARARDALGLTQAEVARAVGVTQGAWGNYERGIRLPDPQAIAKLADLYGVSFDWVFRGNVLGMPAELAAKLLAHRGAAGC